MDNLEIMGASMTYHGWVTEVLDDIIEYAKEKGLPQTERELSQALLKVEREIRYASGRIEEKCRADLEIYARKN